MKWPAMRRFGDMPGLPAALRAPEWGLVAGIATVLVLIYLLEPSHAFVQRIEALEAPDQASPDRRRWLR